MSVPAQENPIVLLSCVKSKRSHRCEAANMYTSPLFHKMMTYAQTLKPKSIFILYANYGLLRPDDMIDPYEQTLKGMKADERLRWAQGVLSALRDLCNLDEDRFVILAGTTYRENLVSHLKNYNIPMAGLSFGKQLQWLTRHLQ